MTRPYISMCPHFITTRKPFSGRYCFGQCLFFPFSMFVSVLSLEWLNQIFTQAGGETWLKWLLVLLFDSHLGKNSGFKHCSCCTGVVFALAQALTNCHALYSLHRFQLPYNNLMPVFDTLMLRVG